MTSFQRPRKLFPRRPDVPQKNQTQKNCNKHCSISYYFLVDWLCFYETNLANEYHKKEVIRQVKYKINVLFGKHKQLV